MGPNPTRQTESQPELLERDQQLESLRSLLSQTNAGAGGRLVLVAGESGGGKTLLVRRFCDEQSDSARVLWGGCDALLTPGPLGPLIEVADSTRGELARVVESEAKAHEVAGELIRELRKRQGTVLVLEDVHWADEATLDVLSLLGRRVEETRALVLVTYRDDALDRADPLRVVLGGLATEPAVSHLAVPRLSRHTVMRLAREQGVDADELYRKTEGNPFFVNEVLAAGAEEIPRSVRDAVLARVSRLSPPARTLLDAVSVVPPRAELWLVEQLASEAMGHLDECLASGMLVAEPDAVVFRHELSRLAVEESVPPDRRLALHRSALGALASPLAGEPDLARLAHHAEAARDAEAVLRYAPAAGSGPPPLAPTARPWPSIGGRSGSPMEWSRRGSATSSTAARTSAIARASSMRRSTCRRAPSSGGARPRTAPERPIRFARCRGCSALSGAPRRRRRSVSGRSACCRSSRRAASWRWPTPTSPTSR